MPENVLKIKCFIILFLTEVNGYSLVVTGHWSNDFKHFIAMRSFLSDEEAALSRKAFLLNLKLSPHQPVADVTSILVFYVCKSQANRPNSLMQQMRILPDSECWAGGYSVGGVGEVVAVVVVLVCWCCWWCWWWWCWWLVVANSVDSVSS